MTKTNSVQLEESQKLNDEIKSLREQLREARESIETFKAGSIDAMVLMDNEGLKVYTENASDKIYRILIEKMHEGAIVIDKDGTILYCNSYFANLMNMPLQKVIGAKLENFSDASSKADFRSLLKQGWVTSIREEINVHTPDGRTIPVRMSLNTLPLDNKFLLSVILTDLTIQNKHQKDLQEKTTQLELKNIELDNSNKDLTSFTYVSSHDLQEPLRKIQNFATCLLNEEEKNLSEAGKGYFERMMKAAKRMQALIEDLITYSRTKNHDRKFEKTDLSKLVDEVKKVYEDEILEKNATIESDNLQAMCIVQFQFRQLLHNLLSNSFKFSKPQSAQHIVITNKIIKGNKLIHSAMSSDIDYHQLTFIDNGIGFDPQYNERIFEVFQRLHSNEDYKGTGMGLAICKRIVENHNGIITAKGKLNEGARFDIYIPVIYAGPQDSRPC